MSPCAGRLPSGRGPNADRPFDEPTTSTARRVAAATWMMSSTTVASRAYAVVPARRSRWSHGGASRPSSAPAAGSARHRADASRRDRAARSPDPQPASCRRSFRRGFRARAAPSTRHRRCPRPDQQPLSGCVGRDVLAGACVPNPGAAGAVPVRVRSRSSAGLRWTRGRLWHPRRQHRPLHTGPGSGDRCKGRRFAPRRMYVPGILSSQPSQVCLPSHGTVPERRANVQKGARPRGTDRRCSVPFRGSAGRRKDAGTRWLGCCPPERSTGETHPRAKRPMNRAKTPLRRRAAPAEGLQRDGRRRLATVAYTLAWTRTRGGGGWMTFGGETEAESLRRAATVDPALVLKTIATEVEEVVSRSGATNGICQALMYGFAKCGLHTSGSIAYDIAYDVWDEVFAVIADRVPRVAAADDPDDVYLPPDPESGEDLPGDLDVAFAAATVAALAHPGREQKRRSLLAAEMLIAVRPTTVTTVLESALLTLSDPATLTWLLRVIERHRGEAASLISECRNALTELAQGPHLTVRALARRLLPSSQVPPLDPCEPDPELLERPHAVFLLSADADTDQPDSAESSNIVEGVAGGRLARAEQLLPGLKGAVVRRVAEAQQDERYRHRMDMQLRAYADQVRRRRPDVVLASVETVEDALQRAAAGARGARLMNGLPIWAGNPGPAADTHLVAARLHRPR